MKNYEAEKLKGIIKAKEQAMVAQVDETDKLRIELVKLRIEYAKLSGEFLGFVEGLDWWELPRELRIKINHKKNELIEKFGD